MYLGSILRIRDTSKKISTKLQNEIQFLTVDIPNHNNLQKAHKIKATTLYTSLLFDLSCIRMMTLLLYLYILQISLIFKAPLETNL